jgi:hypothetical protein
MTMLPEAGATRQAVKSKAATAAAAIVASKGLRPLQKDRAVSHTAQRLFSRTVVTFETFLSPKNSRERLGMAAASALLLAASLVALAAGDIVIDKACLSRLCLHLLMPPTLSRPLQLT